MEEKWLMFLLGVVVGMCACYLVSTTGSNDDSKKLRREISDKLDKAISDIKKTV